ncbi:hypothetical protein CLV98_11424 [Dyadobacter jejuensis]|uniref:Uncharacterized protein n=1 Tax=Dyadobacter jejuensis TaxID=1082580 RepID=A0A316AC09_9BACT|nr:hypothetical protein [Dyadobacter jejuensis]PWJ55255.1 hypothetical protein CLV98_11424 [Dyadobacter jejuensis]
MRILLSFILILSLSLQAQATGYAHNMFVAHKKLQTVKEAPSASKKEPKATSVARVKKPVKPAQASLVGSDEWSDKMQGYRTLNQRILHETRLSFFESEEEESSTTKTIISALIDGVKRMILSVLGVRS